MGSRQVVSFDALRTVTATSTSTTYNAVGGPLTNMVRLICFTNNTNGDMIFSDDGVTDMLFVAAGSFKLFDLNTNRLHVDQMWVLPIGTQWYVRQAATATTGSVYIECLWGAE
jgi:hypothetical protein